MTKKILTGLVVALFFILMGLLVLYFYLNSRVNKQNSILIFVPPQTEFVLRIKETSKTTNSFLNNPVVKEFLNFEELRKYWSLIDSITSRNYKTAEILRSNTSYLCIDSSLNFLILVDLDKRTNEHFIDQFLATATDGRKIEKFKEGYKAFYTKKNEPVYYFVKQNIFAVSKSAVFLTQSLSYSISEKVNNELGVWDTRMKANLAVWGKSGFEKKILNRFTGENPIFGGWLDKLSNTFWFDISMDNKKINFHGELEFDSLNPEIRRFARSTEDNKCLFFQSNSTGYKNESYQFLIQDSLGKLSAAPFMYYYFKDTLDQPVELVVSNNRIAVYLFQRASLDTSVQLIPMADDLITQIAAMGRDLVNKIIPLIPFEQDTGKLFITSYNNYLFIATSTEVLLNHASSYPSALFIKKTLEKRIFLSCNHSWLQKNQVLDYNYQWEKGSRISFTSQITPKQPN